RDFTVNAMAIRLPEGEFVDPFGGVKDLAAKRLDTPLDPDIAFADDPLRMLRAARFAAQLEQDQVHKHKDVLHHTFAVVEKTEADPDDPTLRLAALLHDVGKPKTREIT